MKEMIRWLSRHGFLTIVNFSSGMYLADDLMRWTVSLEIRIPDGVILGEEGNDLEDVLSRVMIQAIVWYERNRPQYLQEEELPMNLKEPGE